MSLPEDKCTICAQESKEDVDHLVCPNNYESWLALLDAARVRHYAPILDIAGQLGDNKIPKLSFIENAGAFLQ